MLLLLALALPVLAAEGNATCASMAACAQGEVVNVPIGSERTQRDYYNNKPSHYDALWGQDNIHFGYFPHLEDPTAVALDFSQGAGMMTRRMVQLGGISHKSRVLDLGCGKGLTCRVVAELTGAHCVGLDLSESNVARAMEASPSHLSLDYLVGSFTDLPASLLEGAPFTHVISQVAFCHVHAHLPQIFAQIRRLLVAGGKGSKAVINDYLGCDGEVSEDTKQHVWKRMHFSTLQGNKAWRRLAEDAGLRIRRYEDLQDHVEYSYRLLHASSLLHNFTSSDGAPLAENYRNTIQVTERREIGMNLAVLDLASVPQAGWVTPGSKGF